MAAPTRSASRLLVVALRPERRLVAGLVAVLVVASVAPLAGPLIIARVVDDALAGRPTGDLALLAGAYLGLAALVEVLHLGLTWASVRLAWRAGNRLRGELADHVLDLELAWHGGQTPGALISRIDGDIEALTTFFSNVVVKVVGNALLVVGVVVVVAVIDLRVAVAIGLTAGISLVLMVWLRAAAVAAREEERAAQAALYGDLEERLGGLEDLRANGAGGYAVHRLLDLSARLWRVTRRAWLRGDGVYALAAGAFALGTVATLAVAVWLSRDGVLTVGSVLATARFSQMLRQPLERVAEQLPELQKALAGANRAASLLAEQPAITDPAPERATPLPPGPLGVELRGASLEYGPGVTGLHPVDLAIPAGCRLGLVGRTGSGKTTLGRLLLRFWDPTTGAVQVGGVDLRDVPLADLRRRIRVVTQEVELLRASLRDNLTMLGAVPADDEALVAALGDVGLDGWLTSLPAGLDTVLGSEVGLSAGERQLLAFARALLGDPGLVVLDEASSRLDPATEARLGEVTERLLSGRTAVIIAHRLSTLDRVDHIAVVDTGRVVEHGPRARLAGDPASRFHRLLSVGGTELLDDVGAAP